MGVVHAETAAAAAAAADTSFFWRHTFPSSSDAKRIIVVAEKYDNEGPMVGHAVVKAISQAKGMGLQSSRAKLLQGMIDRTIFVGNDDNDDDNDGVTTTTTTTTTMVRQKRQ